MEPILTVIEARVIGALMEKEQSTPDYYPMTLNALVNACNQKNNRNPIVTYDEKLVAKTLEVLRAKNFIVRVTSSANRVPKYKHTLSTVYELSVQEEAVLCELLLRGPQTFGELKTRTERLYSVNSPEELETAINLLLSNPITPLIVKMPRQAGHKEQRYAHLLCGEPELLADEKTPRLEDATLAVMAENERIAELEAALEEIKRQISELRQEFSVFKQQFE